MISSLFSKPDLIKTFQPLSDSGKAYLEIQLVNPATGKTEGRGFFNDPDFLLEACRGLVGRSNFCLSNYAYTQAQIPTRTSYNQFDRTLADSPTQAAARAHSLSLLMLFKPELIRETAAQQGQADQYLGILYQIDGILARMNIKCYSMDYFLTGVVLRFWPQGALHKRPLNKSTLGTATKRLLELVEKKMTAQEMKHFALTASVFEKISDPVPGLPGVFAGDAPDGMVVTSSGSLSPGEDESFAVFFEDVFDAKKVRPRESDTFAPPANIQGLSQNWQEMAYEPDPPQGIRDGKGFTEGKGELADVHARENMRELVSWFQNYSQGKWRWPLYSAPFNKIHQGAACGELLLLRCDPFASELGFQFLMQCAEGYCKEGTGQLLIFTKKRAMGDLALAALSRHYKGNPLAGRPAGGTPDAATLAKAFESLFPAPPQIAPCGRSDGPEELLKFLEHDYLPKQRKKGNALMPLAILIDNLDEFAGEDDAATFQGLSQLKMRLREFNSTLWVTRMGACDSGSASDVSGLADHLAVLDHDGSRETRAAGTAPSASEWEASFRLDMPVGKLTQEISLAKIAFRAHGSHRRFASNYAYHRPSCLFKEIGPQPEPQAAPQSVPGSAVARDR